MGNPALRSVVNCIFYNYGMDGYLGLLVIFAILKTSALFLSWSYAT